MVREIPLTKGFVAIVDDEDYDRVMAHGPWQTFDQYGFRYAAHALTGGGQIYLARFLLNEPNSVVDHANGDTLDNRRTNLRVATRGQNRANARKQARSTTSRFKGVCRKRGKWTASIGVNGRKRWLGVFDSEEDAATAYDIAAREHFGEFAAPNFPNRNERGCLLDAHRP